LNTPIQTESPALVSIVCEAVRIFVEAVKRAEGANFDFHPFSSKANAGEAIRELKA
jgi:hypothetical protein